MRVTVYFDGQFWVGVVEDLDRDPPVVARHVFGEEPHDAELLRFVNGQMFSLLADAALAAQTISLDEQRAHSASPRPRSAKRRAREAAEAVREHGVSTHAQLALQQQYEARKMERRVQTREEQDAELQRKRTLKREKARARRRGH